MIPEQRHPQSQKSCKKAEIFVFVMVGLPHQGKSCEKAHNSQREQQNPTEGNEVNPVKPPPVGRSSKLKIGLNFFWSG